MGSVPNTKFIILTDIFATIDEIYNKSIIMTYLMELDIFILNTSISYLCMRIFVIVEQLLIKYVLK